MSELCDNKSKGAQIRSRAQWIEKCERNTSYFLSLEAKHQSSNIIKELVNEDGVSFKSDNKILGEMCNFYEKLYTSRNIRNEDIDIYLSSLENISCLSNDDKTFCETFPTIRECETAVNEMKTNKSPGIDGIPNEFYKKFWNDINNLFYNALREIYDNNEMSFSQKLAIMSLIHKKGDKKSLKNFRPISLTNSDYKIIAFIFAKRLQKVIDKLISKDQSAYIKGRYIGDNARLILDIFEYCTENNQDGILLFFDFEKAFDSIEWNFLFKTLEKLNFGENFIRWMKILYTNPLFRLKNHGWISKTCHMTRGIRQGCPISALLYIFVAEILAQKINVNSDIIGFKSHNMDREIKNIQHADDLSVALRDEKSLKNAIDTIQEFCSHAGSKINLDKTECILLGQLKGLYNELYGVKVSKKAIKVLGIYVGHDKCECNANNWTKVYDDMQKLFESWKRRKLTKFGKTCIINTLGTPKLIYRASILQIPDKDFLKKTNKLIYNFLWKNTERIKRNTLIGNILDGGI